MGDVDLDRRKFFSRGVSGAADIGVKLIEQRVEKKARRWLRPPFALPELDFLLACTRCDACVDACPHQVIFPLPFECGAEVASTPALDLVNKGCHLCAEWPCVEACEPAALVYPAPVNRDQPSDTGIESGSEPDYPLQQLTKLASVRIDPNRCLPYDGPECGACKGSCPVPEALVWQDEKPSIAEEKCVGCALCREACIMDPKAIDLAGVG